MGQNSPGTVTQLLDAVSQGRESAQEELWSLIYDEVRALARQQMAHEPPGRTLQPTVLVHEAYSRLLGQENVRWESRRHFFGAAAQAMRRIRVDHARSRRSVKRGRGWKQLALREMDIAFDDDSEQLLAIDEALERLQQIDAETAEIVKLKYFADLTVKQIADLLGLSPPTIDKRWKHARAWMHRMVCPDESEDTSDGGA